MVADQVAANPKQIAEIPKNSRFDALTLGTEIGSFEHPVCRAIFHMDFGLGQMDFERQVIKFGFRKS